MSTVPSQKWSQLADEMSVRGLEVHVDHELAAHTTYGVGGPARVAVKVGDATQIKVAASVLAMHPDVECLVVGRGSNLLVCDDGFDGVALLTGSMLTSSSVPGDGVDCTGDVVVAGAGVPMPILARRASAAGRTGLEWAVGVPGSLGGAVRMNAGCHGSDMQAVTMDAEVVSLRSGRTVRVDGADLGYHFRGSALAAHHVVVSVRLQCRRGDPDESAEEMSRIVSWRRENQPGGRNAGSVFVNPDDGASAAAGLIDRCGLKGARRGGAEVSVKHANFIQAHDGATATDIVQLMGHVQTVVEQSHGVRLCSEIRLVGFDPEVQRRFVDELHSDRAVLERSERLGVIMGEVVQ